MTKLRDVLANLVAKDRITAQDVVLVRAAIYPDMTINAHEAEALFAVNDTAASTAPEWRQLFVEALTDYLVRQQEPAGYVDVAQAQWLANRITRDGRVKSETELELLIHVLEAATEAPAALSNFALDQVAALVMTPERRAGAGPTLTAEEVRRVRRVLYAFAGDGAAGAVSRREAAVLFALNDAARDRGNAPSWRELFVQAIGASLLAAAGHQRMDRAEAQRLETWLEAPTEGVGSLLSRMLRSNFKEGWRALQEEDPGVARNREAEAAIATAERLTDDEAAWLIDQIGRDGMFDDNEVALLQFVAREASVLSPVLQDLVDRASAQANAARNLGQTPVFGRRG